MNPDALLRLADAARAFAKAYVALVEALLAEGVPEPLARQEARLAATDAAMMVEEKESDTWEP